MSNEVEEFEEKVGTEYVSPTPIIFCYYRETVKNVKILRKEQIPGEAIFIGFYKNTRMREYWSREYFVYQSELALKFHTDYVDNLKLRIRNE